MDTTLRKSKGLVNGLGVLQVFIGLGAVGGGLGLLELYLGWLLRKALRKEVD